MDDYILRVKIIGKGPKVNIATSDDPTRLADAEYFACPLYDIDESKSVLRYKASALCCQIDEQSWEVL